MFSELLHRLASHNKFQELVGLSLRLEPGERLGVTGVAGSLESVLLTALHDRTERQLLVIARDRASAERLHDDLRLIMEQETTSLFGGFDDPDRVASEGRRNVEDVATLRSLLSSQVEIVVTHPLALFLRFHNPATLRERFLAIEMGRETGFLKCVEWLGQNGFEKKDFVETHGDYSVRGGILDVFPFVGGNPVRIEFFGDSVESIREFDALSQRSVRELSIATLVPDLLRVPTGESAGSQRSSLLDFLQPDALVVMEDPELIPAAITEEEEKRRGDRQQSWQDVEELLSFFPQMCFFSLPSAATQAVDFASHSQPSFNGSIKVLKTKLAGLQRDGYSILVCCDSQSELARLKELLAEVGSDGDDGSFSLQGTEFSASDVEKVQFSLHALHEGFVLPDSKFALFTEHQIFNRLKRRGRQRKPRFRGFSTRELQQLHKGDYVVHMDYGIGRFDGLKKIRVGTVEQEVVRLRYEENDTLYVNLNYIGKIQKYSSREGHIPKLTRLGSTDWDRIKSRAKKRIKDIARDLIQLYAQRKTSQGVAFDADAPWQKELEASFAYEDTYDQARSTREVKLDMEASYPMDRLVCGDVGFGKTEVAVRAAFKCVLSGKQVAVLVPTTILALQHYNTFVDRVSRYSVNVQVLSRFKTKKEQVAIIEQLKTGAIDIVIGTHRLLSKDAGFKDLGLLVIDEEHRFGVSAKEKLRRLRTNVDTLTLTATPIPRTLHFSLLGARDLSIIATPPRNRLPVITEITQYSSELVTEAVRRELRRGGQAYYVHDRVHTIGEVAAELQALLPDVRIRFAHGQMPAHELEKVMLEFLERNIDVLVCTKIIESGLDLPNVNTIIINRADRFGMAELYQLRGRVGRSNQQAYAYLLVPPLSILPKSTVQRLQALEEFTELGSGFNLAMRDLEIRGAGNLLGAEQSGFIETMGFETYSRILDEAVNELKEQEFQQMFEGGKDRARSTEETVIEAEFDALIPNAYVENDAERLEIYRRLYGLSSLEQLREMAAELVDRFGQHPLEVVNLLGVIQVRLAASRIGARKVRIVQGGFEVEFPPETDRRFYDHEDFQQMIAYIGKMGDRSVALAQTARGLRLAKRFPAVHSDNNPFHLTFQFLSGLAIGIEKQPAPVP